MNIKTPKFLIAENPMVDDGRVFILHSRSPVIIAEAYHLDPDDENAAMEIKRNIDVGAIVDYPGEYIILGAVFIEPEDNSDTQEYADKLAKIMRRMGDWYRAYLEWEDSQL